MRTNLNSLMQHTFILNKRSLMRQADTGVLRPILSDPMPCSGVTTREEKQSFRYIFALA